MNKPALADWPLHELLARRWSPRAFEPRPISVEAVRSLLEAARWAASCFNDQPWNYLVALREDEEEFARMLGVLMPPNQRWAKDAGALFIAVSRDTFLHNGAPNRFGGYDTGQATASLALQAEALGLAAHQMGGFHADAARQVYGIPEGFTPMAAVAVGWPGAPELLPEDLAAKDRAPRARRAQADFAFFGAWGRSER